jgi:stage III sporulation protein AA
MLKKILPDNIYNTLLNKVNFECVNEIRIRADKPIVLSIGANKLFLGENGTTGSLKEAIFGSKIMIEDIIFRASECSIYSVNEQIKKGFIITEGGLRLGIGGDLIEENGVIKTMTNFSSVNIRIPHEIKNCCLPIFDLLLDKDKIFNTLIISPPGGGKTTFLRDFVCQLSERNYAFNVLILDERGEIDIGKKCSIGNFADKISFAKKKVGFENGIRSLSPNLIVTDELGQEEDGQAINYAVNCGVNIFASVHANGVDDLVRKPFFEQILKDKVFKRFVVLSLRNGPGTIESVYNENFSRLR